MSRGVPRAGRWRRFTRFEALNLAAMAPALAFGVARYMPEAYASRPSWLYATMQIEFLVIHSFAFIGFAVAWRPEGLRGQIMRQVLFWGLMSLYLAFAYKNGWQGIAIFLSATLATYLGLLLNLKSPVAVAELVTRWLFLFFLSIIVWAMNDMPEDVGNWDRTERTLNSGLWYFGIIALMELLGFFRSPALSDAYRQATHEGARRPPG